MSDFLKNSRVYWDRHAQRDPLWAILSDPAKRDGKWDVGRFFQTGTTEIEFLLYEIDTQQLALRRGAALDFGCGVGRLTQALAPHFDRVIGVDISPSMVDLATRLNQHPQTVSYVSNQAPDLSLFEDGSFDFIVSSIVLHHVKPDLACSYIREFFRVLAPGGIAVFQLASHHRRAGIRPVESIVTRMPEDAYRASLLVAGVPAVIKPGDQINLPVDVTNVSAFDWSQREYGVFSLGNHWLASGGRMLTRDDGRTKLPAVLRSGQTCRLSLTINVPAERGEYELEVDVAHEGVLWFQELGSEVVRLAIRVGEHESNSAAPVESVSSVSATPPPAAAPEVPAVQTRSLTAARTDMVDPGEFPMYGVPLNTIAGLIADHDAILLHVDSDLSGGEDWVSYRYFVRAAASGRSVRK